VDPRSVPTEGSSGDVVAPPRQRWRLVVARSADAPRLAGRELSEAWESAIEASGLPIHRPAGRPRGRVAFGASLPLGITADRELIDIFMAAPVPVWRVRDALAGRLPEGWRLVDVFDVWVGAPPLAGRVIGADYRIELAGDADAAAIAGAARVLLSAATLPRQRDKGDASVDYDLRPLLADLRVVEPGPPVVLRIRGRIHPELGTGRPDDVVAALGDELGRPLEVRGIVRERLIVAGDPG
jgi:radical SAM-linked protein